MRTAIKVPPIVSIIISSLQGTHSVCKRSGYFFGTCFIEQISGLIKALAPYKKARRYPKESNVSKGFFMNVVSLLSLEHQQFGNQYRWCSSLFKCSAYRFVNQTIEGQTATLHVYLPSRSLFQEMHCSLL